MLVIANIAVFIDVDVVVVVGVLFICLLVGIVDITVVATVLIVVASVAV